MAPGQSKELLEHATSAVRTTMDSIKSTLRGKDRGAGRLPDDEEDSELQRRKTAGREERARDYERFQLAERTVFGTGDSAGVWRFG